MTQIKKAKPLCRACGVVELTDDHDSAAHIIPNALGGRLAPKGLICRTCNTLLDSLADNALIKAFGPWPTLINVHRDRGEHPPVRIETASGARFRVTADAIATRDEVVYNVQPVTDGHKVSLGASNMKVVKQLIDRAVDQFPQLDREQAILHATKVQEPTTELWRVQTNFAPANVFPAAFVAFWLYFLHKTDAQLESWPRIQEVIEGMRTGGTFRYLPEGLPGLTGPEIPFAHRIVLRAVPATGELIGYLEILGTLRIGGVIAKGSLGCELEHIYVADPFGRTDRSADFSINKEEFDAVNWRTVGIDPSDTAGVQSYITAAQAPLQKHWEERVKAQ